MKISHLLFAFLMAGMATGALAQSNMDDLAKVMARSCIPVASRLVDRPEFGALSAKRPISTMSACTCAEEKFKADKRLAAYLDVDVSTYARRIQIPETIGYITMRLFNSLMVCLQPEVAATLDAASLPE